MTPPSAPLIVTLYVPAGVPLAGGVLLALLPLPHAAENKHAPNKIAMKHKVSSFPRFGFIRPAPLNKIAGIIKPTARRIPFSWFPQGSATPACGPAVVMVSVAVPVLLATEIAPKEQVAGELTAGVMLQPSVRAEGFIPPAPVIVTVAFVEAPGAIVEGDGVLAEMLKFGAFTIRLTTCDALALNVLSPLYSAEMLCVPAARVEVVKLATPLPLTADAPSVVVPSRKVRVPESVPGDPDVTVAVNETL